MISDKTTRGNFLPTTLLRKNVAYFLKFSFCCSDFTRKLGSRGFCLKFESGDTGFPKVLEYFLVLLSGNWRLKSGWVNYTLNLNLSSENWTISNGLRKQFVPFKVKEKKIVKIV